MSRTPSFYDNQPLVFAELIPTNRDTKRCLDQLLSVWDLQDITVHSSQPNVPQGEKHAKRYRLLKLCLIFEKILEIIGKIKFKQEK